MMRLRYVWILFLLCLWICAALTAKPENRQHKTFGSAHLLNVLWPGKELTSSFDNVLFPKAIKADVFIPSYTSTPKLPALPSSTKGTIRSVRVRSNAKYVAVTLDYCELCTNVNGYQSQVVKYLREQNIPATLFISGKWMQSHSDITQQLMVDPLFEIGNHAWTHANFALTPIDVMDQQVLATQGEYIRLREVISQKASKAECVAEIDKIPFQPTLFRLPYGRCNEAAFGHLAQLGFKVIQWNHVGLEGYLATKAECEAFVEKLSSGSIILLHGNNVPKHTLNFLQHIVPLLRQKGFECLRVSELLEIGTPAIQMEGYFMKPGDNLNLDTQFGYMGTGIQK